MNSESTADHWISVSELARRRGLSRQSVHEQIEKLERAGQIETRRRGREKQVDALAYERIALRSGPSYRLAEAQKMLRAMETLLGELSRKLDALTTELDPSHRR